MAPCIGWILLAKCGSRLPTSVGTEPRPSTLTEVDVAHLACATWFELLSIASPMAAQLYDLALERMATVTSV